MDRELSGDEIERLATALNQLVDEGDMGASRTVVWISYVLAGTQARLQFDQRSTLAELAGRGALRSGTPSLATLAVRLLDPILWTVGRGEEQLDPEDHEHLNDMRRRIMKLTARNSL